ncbi:MAG: hypothetical protein Q4E86_07515 [Lachnospiraceae bacterium]|nr:hypothetical protein [Lachnospiraceae bacterium]MDO5551515.1 hypothetical protein [Lachnospiraceae bacterium]
MEGNTWITYENCNVTARKCVEAGPVHVNLTLHQGNDGRYDLIIEAGIESISVALRSETLKDAFREADEFSKDYFLDRAKLLEEIAQRILE